MTGSLHVSDPASAEFAEQRLWRWIGEIDDACNRFRDDSEITRLNESAGATREVSPTLRRALEAALDAAERTEGLCTPTVLTALRAWGYDEDYEIVRDRGREREPDVVSPSNPLEDVEYDAAAGTVRLRHGCQLDLGATAKALAADLVADDVAPYTGVVVEIGGDVAVRGTGPQGPWVVGVSTGLEIRGGEPRVVVSGGGLATSSSVVRTWTVAGRVVGHIIDPRTGRPAHGPVIAATVAADSCVHANALATASLVREVDSDYYLAQTGWSGRLVRRDGTVVYVGGWPDDEGGRA